MELIRDIEDKNISIWFDDNKGTSKKSGKCTYQGEKAIVIDNKTIIPWDRIIRMEIE